MPKFNVGDRVERIGTLIPDYMKEGTVTRVIPNADLPDDFTEYAVDFKCCRHILRAAVEARAESAITTGFQVTLHHASFSIATRTT